MSNDDLIQIFGKDLLSNNMVMPIEIMARVQQLPRYQDGLLSYFYSYIRTTINRFFKDQSNTSQDELEITLHYEVDNIIGKTTNEANTKFRYESDNDKRLSLIFFTWAAYREIAKNLINVNYISLASEYHKKLVEVETIVKATGGLTLNEIISQVPKNPKQVSSNRQKKILIPLARTIWEKHDVSYLISPTTMAEILIHLHSPHNDKTPSSRTLKDWLRQHKNIIPEKVASRLSIDPNYILNDKELDQLDTQKLLILEKYKDTCKQV